MHEFSCSIDIYMSQKKETALPIGNIPISTEVQRDQVSSLYLETAKKGIAIEAIGIISSLDLETATQQQLRRLSYRNMIVSSPLPHQIDRIQAVAVVTFLASSLESSWGNISMIPISAREKKENII